MPQHGQTTTPPTRLPPSPTGPFGSSGTAGSATPELSSLPGSCRAPGGLAGIRVGGVRGSARIPGHPEQTEAHTTLPLPVNVTMTLLRLSGSVSCLMSPFVATRLSRFATAPEVTIVLLSSAPTVSRSMTSPANLKPDDPTRRDATRAARSRGRSTRDNPTRRDATLLEGTQSIGVIDDPTRRDATELPSTDSLSTSVPTEFRDDRLRRL